MMNVNNNEHWLLGLNRAAVLSLAVLIAGITVQYYQDIRNMMGRWDSADLSYGYLVPFLFVYLVYLKKDIFRSYPLRSSFSGVILLLFSGVIYLVGKQGSLETVVYMSLWLVIISAFLIVTGVDIVRRLAFPFLILGFMVPVPSYINQLFTFQLKLISSGISVAMMRTAGLLVFRDGNIIDLGVTQLQVADACSGLRYVYPLLLTGFVLAYLFHKRFWERLAVVGITIPVSVIANALRIAITGYLTIRVTPEAAQGFFHGFSGWLMFMFSFVVILLFSRIIKMLGDLVFKEKIGSASSGISLKGRQKGASRNRLLYIWTGTVLALVFWGINSFLESPLNEVSRKSFDAFPNVIGDWDGARSYLEQDVLEMLWADDYLVMNMTNRKSGDALILLIPYYKYQGTKHTAHAPAACLVGSGYALLEKDYIKKEFPEPYKQAEIGRMVLEKGGQKVLSNFWFQGRGRITGSEYLNKWRLFLDSFTMRRNDGALVRMEMFVKEGQTIEEAQNELDRFTLVLMKILPEYVPE